VDILVDGITAAAKAAGIPLTSNRIGGMFGLFFTDTEKVTNFAQATACDEARFKAFYHAMLERGIYFAPSCFEAGFVSAAHTEVELQATIDAAASAFKEIA